MSRNQAIKTGSTVYFTGKPCPRGHIAPRWVHGTCKTCRAGRRPNRDTQKRWRNKNIEKVRAVSRAISARWRKNNPGKNAANVMKWRSDLDNRTPSWLTDEDHDTMRRFYECCPAGYEVDHIIPLRGKTVSGLHVPENLQWLSADINKQKGNHYVPNIISRVFDSP